MANLPLMLLAVGAASASIAATPETSESGRFIADVDQASLSAQMRFFGSELRQLGFAGTLTACQKVVLLLAGSHNGDQSSGGACELQIGERRVHVVLCDDTLAGHFAMSTSVFPVERDETIAFTDQNCTSG